MVFPHRACGSAAGAALFPVYRWGLNLVVSADDGWESLETSCGRGEPGRQSSAGRLEDMGQTRMIFPPSPMLFEQGLLSFRYIEGDLT